jgi:two-component system cell cycle response regulator
MEEQPSIMIVDDDLELLQMLKSFFSSERQACETFLRAEEALTHLAAEAPEIMLADIVMPGMEGLELTKRAKRIRPDMNIIVMTGFIDKFSYHDVIAAGASDFIKKPFSLNELNMRISHVRLQEKLRMMSITDDLTGLPNRRGFFALAEHTLKAAARGKRDSALCFIDLDGFKAINDTWGHHEGDRALVNMADIFRRSFRASDIVARMSGDEFAVLIVDTPRQNIAMILDRLQKNISQFNERKDATYGFSISIGISFREHTSSRNIDEMLHEADALMYEQKLNKKAHH